MATAIIMPRLSDSMEEGTILKWMKSVGDEVALGEELVEIVTDKANMVYEADAAGTLIEIVAAEGDTLPIGDVIARLGEASEMNGGGDGGGEARRSSSAVRAPQPPSVHAVDTSSDVPGSGPTPDSTDIGRVKASPVARRVARERGLDLTRIRGSGRGGRIVKADVESALASGSTSTTVTPHPSTPGGSGPTSSPAQAGMRITSSLASGEAPPASGSPPASAAASPSPDGAQTAKGTVQVVEPTRLQQTVARRMAESKATAPHFYLSTEAEMDRAFQARAALKARAAEGEMVPSFNDLVVKACAVALREHPRANGAYRDGRFELYERINVGIAVAAADALVVPTIFDADRKGLAQITTESRALAQRVRSGVITPPELSGGTFTVSNLGMYGVSDFAAVINSPQAAILAVGAIREQAVVVDGEVVAGRRMGMTLACDHRILYGADGAQLLARVRALLEEPLGLAL